MRPDAAVLRALLEGEAHRFADPISVSVPVSGAGAYTIWDADGALVYVGVAGRNPSGSGLARRLLSHASGRRSGDQFCVYVADHYVMPELSRSQIDAIAASELSLDSLVRDRIRRSFVYRVAAARRDYSAALAVESWLKSGHGDCGPPRSNPSRGRGSVLDERREV